MVRSVGEWQGKNDNTPVPKRVKLRILARQGDKCADCERPFTARLLPKFDHRPALCNGGENRESKIFARCDDCHDPLTVADVGEKSKTNDMKAKHLGLHKPKRPFPKRADPWNKNWRPMATGGWQRIREE